MGETTVANNITTFATAELQANTYQQAPVALVPLNDAMTFVNGAQSLSKVNAFRAGSGQPVAPSTLYADGTAYCNNIYYIATARLAINAINFANFASPVPSVASNLYAFMLLRLYNTFGAGGLNCVVSFLIYSSFDIIFRVF